MSSGAISQHERKKIACECGNMMEYLDMQQNCDFPMYCVLSCVRCAKKHRVVLDGTLGEPIGAEIHRF